MSFTILNAQSFSQSLLDYNGNGRLSSGTSLMFGPDGRLYATEYTGRVRIFDIERLSPGNYVSQGRETLDDIRDIQDHNDDGTLFSTRNRETIGLVVVGTAENPVIYVSSSDFRIGGGLGGGSGDSNLDTNSGIITRLTRNGNSWDVVDIVRGLPRSEENHASNGLEFVTVNGRDYLLVAQGGHTNAGAPSTNFNWTTEYALAAAVLSIDLTAIEAMPILTDNGRNYIYDLPTLDDPTRANVNGIVDPNDPGYDGIDINDPFGGNDGLNQAVIVPGGPVQIFSPGYRNAYDLVVTESGGVYITDNGANAGWGGFPVNEGVDGTATNDYDPLEPGSSSPSGGEAINNEDHLTRITLDIQNYPFGSFYGGHPVPVRANPSGAGLYTAPLPTSLDGAVFRTQLYDPDGSTPGSTTDPSIALPANWPPVPLSGANPVEGDWRGPELPNPDGPEDDIVTIWSTNTNGIAEYTASNFGGAMQGDLIAGSNQNGNLRRVQLNPDGTLQELTQEFASGLGGNTLGVSCNSDTDPFPGTIWVTNFGLNGITVLEPQDTVNCIAPGEPGYDPLADYDQDGYTNQDEEDNGTDPCNGGSQPSDFDIAAGGTLISDLNDTDDDSDGILDANDPFQLGNPTETGSDAFAVPIENELFSNNPALGGYLGLGFTGMMNNGDVNRNWLDWIDRRDDPNDPNPNDILGGAIGAMTMQMTVGTAFGNSNNQEKAFQYGIQTDIATGTFTILGGMGNFTAPRQLYGNDAAPNGEVGFFLGDGTQSNYIKFVLTRNGFLGIQEINDVVVDTVELPIAVGNRPSGSVTCYFVVDATNGTISLEYALDNGTRTVMTSLTAQGSILTAIQQTNQDLAIGLIGTSNASGVELEGTWDVLSVLNSDPFITQGITESNVSVGQTSDTFDLNAVFGDDNGVGNLTYTIFSNTNIENLASIVDNILTIDYALSPAISEITLRATDVDGNFVDHMVTVTVSENATVLYRINAGGPEIPAIDGGIAWSTDLAAPNNSEFLVEAASDQVFGFSVVNFTPEVNLTTTPQDIFQTERYDNVAGAPNMTYSFPVAEVGNYEVRLYIANGFDGTNQIGDRIFDVTIEGITYPLLDEIDLIDRYGDQTGAVISHILNVADGSLDISFIHSLIENPLVNGIEILAASNSNTPIYVGTLEDQTNEVGEQLNGGLIASAFGGDGNLNYTLSGQPLGITIDPTNGQIGGTIDESIVLENPYTVTLTVDDSDGITTDAVAVTFTWIATNTPIVIDALTNQVNQVNTVLDGSLSVMASGGDGNLSYSAVALPIGLSIDEATGQISGTITPDAYINSPYDVVVTVNDADSNTSDIATIEFQWRVTPLWTDLNENQNYTARHENSFVQAGDRFYLMGGRENANTIDVYNYTNNTWEALTDITPIDPDDPTRRLEFNHFQATEYQGLIWVIGAFQTNNFPNEVPANFIWIFDPVNLEWIQGPEIPEARRRGSAGLALFNDRFYILGGNTDGHDGGFVPWFDEYDPATGIWTVLEDAPNARDHFNSVVLGNTLYATAGRLSGGAGGVFAPTIAEVDQYDFTTGTWSTLPAAQNIPTPRAGASTIGYNNQLIVIGGEAEEQNTAFATTEAFDVGLGEWITLNDLNSARHGTQAILSGNGIFTLGGSPNLGGGNQRNLEVLGENNPLGEPNFAGPITAPNAVLIENDTAVDITFSGADYTYGFFVRSMEISGVDADNFSITAGNLTNSVLISDRLAGFSHTVTVALDSQTIGNAAVLTINYGADSSLIIDLSDDLIVAPNVANPGDQNSFEGEVVALQIEVTDNSEELTYSATNLPPGLDIDTVTGLISGTVQGAAANSPYNVTVAVQGVSSSTVDFIWTVDELQVGVIWIEDFEDLTNGTTIDNGTTAWSSIRNGGVFEVNNGAFLTNSNSDGPGVWTSGVIQIDGMASITIDVNDGDDNKENADFVRASYRVDGGPLITFGEVRGDIDPQTFSVESINGSSLQIVVESDVSFTNEFYTIDNVTVSGIIIPRPEFILVVDSGGGDGNFTEGTEVIITSDTPPVGEEFDTWTGDISGILDVNASTTVLTMPASNVTLTATYRAIPSTGIIWLEDFEDLPNGAFVDNGDTAWTSFRNGGLFEVNAGTFITTNNSDGPGVWTSELIPINGIVSISIDVDDGDDNKENADFVRASYRVDEGPLIVLGEVRGDIAAQTFTATGIIGNTVQIVIEADVSFDNEIYNIDNITVLGEGPLGTNTAPVAIADASNLSGIAPAQINFTGSNSTDDTGIVTYDWNFDDGNTSNEINPSHTFVNPGVYNVSLRVVDAQGLEDTTSLLITVETSPLLDGVVSFTLVDATTNQDLFELTDGMQIDAFSIQGLSLNIRANTNIPVRSVRLDQSGPLTAGRTENIAPYALFADQSGDYFGRSYPDGDYTITATSYSERSLGGIQGATLSISFSIVPQAAAFGIDGTEFVTNEMQVQLFPNPVSSDAQIRVLDTEAEMKQINVFDITGRLIQQYDADKVRIGGGLYQFNVSKLENGLYFINMTSTSEVSHTMKMVINR